MVSRYQQVLSMRWKSIREMGTQCGEDKYREQSAHFFRGVLQTKTPQPFFRTGQEEAINIYILYPPRYVPLKHKADLPCLHKSINLQINPKTTHIVESFWSICQVQATTPAS